MSRFLLFLVFLSSLSLAALAASADVQLLKQARSQIRVIAGELRQRIDIEVLEGGAENALASCRLTIEGLTDRLATHSGWEIRRTAFRVRNSKNAPDPWEREILGLFQRRQDEGRTLAEYEFAEVVNRDGKRVFRYMKPIVMQEFCMTCHGPGVAPEVQAKIAEKYPGDQAVDFEPGELRGAFSLLKVLPGEPP